MTERTPDHVKQALQDLIHSDGWTILKELVDEQFGPAANLQQIDAAMLELRPGDDERAVVTQIRAASKAAYTVLALAENRLRAVQQAEKPKFDPFAAMRRGPRTSSPVPLPQAVTP